MQRDALDGAVTCGDLILTHPGLPLRSGVGATMRAETPSDECIEHPRDDASATAAVAYNPLLISFRWIIAMHMFEATARPDGAVGCRRGASRTHDARTSRSFSAKDERSPSGWCILLSGLHLTFHGVFVDEDDICAAYLATQLVLLSRIRM